jgi:hypothetical protein
MPSVLTYLYACQREFAPPLARVWLGVWIMREKQKLVDGGERCGTSDHQGGEILGYWALLGHQGREGHSGIPERVEAFCLLDGILDTPSFLCHFLFLLIYTYVVYVHTIYTELLF